jgi:hypothetical protein
VSLKSFPDYKYFLQENYVEYKHISFSKCNSTQEAFFYNTLVHFNICSFCIPRRFLVIKLCNQGKILCSPCIYLKTNSDLCHLQHKLIGFYNRDEKCLLCDTNRVFKQSSLRFVFKWLIHPSDIQILLFYSVTKIHSNKFNFELNNKILTVVFCYKKCKKRNSMQKCVSACY